MSIRLYEFQKRGINFLRTQGRALLADEMGLGKTIQAIEASRGLNRVLIIAPKTLHRNWELEISKWNPGIPVERIKGGKNQKLKAIAEFERGYLIINYELCRAITGRNNPYLDSAIKRKFDGAIVDEAHNIKNRKSQQSVGIRKLCSKIPHVYLLTGTPIVNRTDDLWALLNLIDRKAFSSFWGFCRKYAKVNITYWGWVVDPKPRNPARLRRDLTPYVLRRSKEEVMSELPTTTNKTIRLEMTPEQSKLYQKCKKEISVELANNKRITILGILPRIVRLKQVASCPSILSPGMKSNKEECLLDIIEEVAEDDKILIFSSYNKTLDYLSKFLGENDVQHFVMNGETPMKERYKLIKNFGGQKIKVFLMNTSLGVGLNLTAASVVVFMDKPWSPAIIEQAISRVHRKGQTKPVTVINLIMEGTIEEWIENLIYKKENILEEIIGELRKEVFNEGADN